MVPENTLPQIVRFPSWVSVQTVRDHLGTGQLSLLSRHGFWCTGRRKGVLHSVLFASGSNTNRSNLDFPFLRPVAAYTRLWTQGQKAGPHMGLGHLSLLSGHAFWCTCRRKGKFRLVLFVSEFNTNRSNLDFPFLRQVDPNDPRGCFFVFLGGRY